MADKKEKSILPKVNFMGLDVTYEEARAVILPAPFASTSISEQTLLGPSEILENWNMEDYDLQLNYSPCAARIYPLPERIYSGDAGLNSIYMNTKKIIQDGKFPVVLGGDQAVSLATVKAASEEMKKKGEEFSVLIIDAHTDMKDEFEGNKNSNLSVTKRLVENKIKVSLLGTRSIGSEEIDEAEKLDAYCRISNQKELNDFLKGIEDNIYISIDVDAFDPSLMPATLMPEPWGLSWDEVVSPLIKIGEKRNIIGVDITEHAPINGFKMPSIICAQLAYKLIGIKFKRQAEEEGWEECYEGMK
ncbi:MAG: arginase family protein [Candidatus Micrarchaeia archaeon]